MLGVDKIKVWPWKSEKGRDSETVTVNFGENILPVKKVSVQFGD